MRRLCLLLLLPLLTSSLARAEYPIGAFSRLAKYREGYLWNGFFGVQVERGFKLHALVPEPAADGTFGRPEYAGFLTLEVNGEPFFQRFAQAEDGTQPMLSAVDRVVVAKTSEGYREVVELAHGYPFAWFWATTPAADTGDVTWLLTGYQWAQKKPPQSCQLALDGEQPQTVSLEQPDTEVLPAGRHLGNPLVLLHDAAGKFDLALFLAQSPTRLWVRQDGLAIQMPRQESRSAPFAVSVPAPGTAWEAASALTPLAFSVPTYRNVTFGSEAGGPAPQFEARSQPVPNEWEIAPQATVALPPTVADRAPADAIKLPTLFGDVALCPGKSARVALAPVARLAELAPTLKPLRPQWRDNMARDVDGVLGQLRPAGGFNSSQGRTFYDGLTCSGLMLAYPYLEPARQKLVAEAVRRTLDLWWNGLRQDGETGIWYFPEPVPAVPVVDYPEITATILWPTLQYATVVDPAYAKALAPKLARLGPSLAKAYDWTGAAYAYPGPEFLHIITESVIGGLVAWCAMSQLAVMNDQPQLAEEYAARAAFAAESMKLLRWQDRYGPPGIVSELRPDSMKVRPTIAWDYTMYTWFSFVPACDLPREDIYKVWDNLEKAQWWNYSETSKQRCYDYAHAIALARTFGPQAIADKLPLFDDRPFSYESFDSTPVYRLMAYPWLAATQ